MRMSILNTQESQKADNVSNNFLLALATALCEVYLNYIKSSRKQMIALITCILQKKESLTLSIQTKTVVELIT